MRTIEMSLKGQAFQRIVGIDEAGRGPLAGPVVAAAVQVVPEIFSAEIKDSKRLSPRKRELAYEEILSTCAVGVGVATASEIDALNILRATFLAMKRALEALPMSPDICLVDGQLEIPDLLWPQKAIIKGDNLSISIAAASIVAKVERDRIMTSYHDVYPMYNFGQHKGYATKEHIDLIAKYGRCPLHRASFKLAGGL